jgi:5-methylcytosine-specific restriction endonuclease McrA
MERDNRMGQAVVSVLDQSGDRLENCTKDRADALVNKGQAEVVSDCPLVIRLKRATGNGVPPSLPSVITESQKKRASRLRALRLRDGSECFYCGVSMESEDITLEHLLSLKDGGATNLANLVLAHRHCNEKAADLPVIAKIKLRESLRSRKSRDVACPVELPI